MNDINNFKTQTNSRYPNLAMQASESVALNTAAQSIIEDNRCNVVVRADSTKLLDMIIEPLQEQGRKLMLINFQDLKHSYAYNPLYGIATDDADLIRAVASKVIDGAYSQSVLPAAIDFLTFAIAYTLEFLPEYQRDLHNVYKLASLFQTVNDDEHFNGTDNTLLSQLVRRAKMQNPKANTIELWDHWYGTYLYKEKVTGVAQVTQRLNWVNQKFYTDLCSTAYQAKRDKSGDVLEHLKERRTDNLIPETNNVITTKEQKGTVIYILENSDIITPDMFEYAYDFRQMVLRLLDVRLKYDQPDTQMVIHLDKNVFLMTSEDWKKYNALSDDFTGNDDTLTDAELKVKTDIATEVELPSNKNKTAEFIDQIQILSSRMSRYESIEKVDVESKAVIAPERRTKGRKIETRADLMRAMFSSHEQYPMELLEGDLQEQAAELRDKLDEIFLQALSDKSELNITQLDTLYDKHEQTLMLIHEQVMQQASFEKPW